MYGLNCILYTEYYIIFYTPFDRSEISNVKNTAHPARYVAAESSTQRNQLQFI